MYLLLKDEQQFVKHTSFTATFSFKAPLTQSKFYQENCIPYAEVWINGWMDELIERKTDRETDRQRDRETERRMDGETDGRMDGWTDGHIDLDRYRFRYIYI